MTLRHLKWPALGLAGLLAGLLLAGLALALFGLNWARGPLQDFTLRHTGREMRIEGDLRLHPAWPLPRLTAQGVRFANPAWATAPQMLSADTVELSIDLRELLLGGLSFPEVRLVRPRVFLEQGRGPDGVPRKTWLLDRAQSDEGARIPIGRVLLDRGELDYVDAEQRTAVHVELSTLDEGPSAEAATADGRKLRFKAGGRLRGLPLTASGSGGGVLAWRDETLPYPLQISASIGRTEVQAEGSVTSLMQLRAVDLQLALRGDDLAALVPLLGIALPPTPPYRVQGRLLREGRAWRFVTFTGELGHSDVAGTLQLDTAGARPMLRGGVSSRRFDLADLGPAVGARDTRAEARPRVLPDLPFDTARWGSLDADLAFAALSLLRRDALPLDKLQVRVLLQDRQLTLDSMSFGLAGGQLRAQVVLDGRAEPLHGQATLQMRGVQIARLLPAAESSRASLGRVDGDAELSGQGASVGAMLAGADGRLTLVAQDGRVSRLLMEQIGLHLLEILRLNLSGDESIPLRCAVADFGITRGLMQVRALVLDTSVSTVLGSGSVNLADETLDLRFVPRTKVTSLLALRSPIYLRGPFSAPAVTLDTGRIATRGLGALALGLLNPLLALLPLFEAGPGADSPCSALVREARAPVKP